MYIEAINGRGNSIVLSENPLFWLSNIDGQTTGTASVSTSTVATMDGDIVNNVVAQPRSIVIDLTLKSDVERAKSAILDVVKLKQNLKLRMVHGDRDIEITGIVESIDFPRWAEQGVIQITLYCSQPFWEDVAAVIQIISEWIDMLNFEVGFPEDGIPFGEIDLTRTQSITNDGDSDTGVEIKINAIGIVSNPMIYTQDGDYIGCNITMQSGDEIVISTYKGNKTMLLNGTSVLNDIMPMSKWLQLPTGTTEFTISSDNGTENNMYFTITYKQRYL